MRASATRRWVEITAIAAAFVLFFSTSWMSVAAYGPEQHAEDEKARIAHEEQARLEERNRIARDEEARLEEKRRIAREDQSRLDEKRRLWREQERRLREQRREEARRLRRESRRAEDESRRLAETRRLQLDQAQRENEIVRQAQAEGARRAAQAAVPAFTPAPASLPPAAPAAGGSSLPLPAEIAGLPAFCPATQTSTWCGPYWPAGTNCSAITICSDGRCHACLGTSYTYDCIQRRCIPDSM